MKLHIATLPDQADALPSWLEGYLRGPALRELVAELAALHGNRPASDSARGLLRNSLPDVLERGLAVIPPEILRLFLRHPPLLFELQEIVLTEGGPYWNRLLTDHGIARTTDRVGRRLRVALGLETPPPPGKYVRLRFYRRPWLVGLATAAAVLVAVYFGRSYLEGMGRWGWERPGLLTREGSSSSYLNALADAAAEWGERPKDSREDLLRSLRELRDGCTRLLAAAHRPLAKKDRDWLIGKCRDWGEDLDQQLADLQTGKEWRTVRAQADQTVTRLTGALRARARQVERVSVNAPGSRFQAEGGPPPGSEPARLVS